MKMSQKTYYTFILLRTSKILPRLNVLIFFQQFEAQNVLILFLTAIFSLMVENRLQRPSGVYVCPVFSSRTCVHARHVILMVLHVVMYCIKLQCEVVPVLLFDNINCGAVLTACHAHFGIFSFFNFHFSLKLFLICSYFSSDLSLTVLIKSVLNKKNYIGS